MGQKEKQLSHAEIWDDSALLQSWNDALTEYKHYHGIHARGERVEDVIKEAVAQEESMHMNEDDLRSAAAGTPANGISSEKLGDGKLEEEPERAQEHSHRHSTGRLVGPSTSRPHQQHPLPDASATVDQSEMPSMPNVVTNGVNDETLKNLMMSWYYAGYYSGLYEGQQQLQSHTCERGN